MTDVLDEYNSYYGIEINPNDNTVITNTNNIFMITTNFNGKTFSTHIALTLEDGNYRYGIDKITGSLDYIGDRLLVQNNNIVTGLNTGSTIINSNNNFTLGNVSIALTNNNDDSYTYELPNTEYVEGTLQYLQENLQVTKNGLVFDETKEHYFSTTVENICIGRAPLTNFYKIPDHVYDVVWRMDLNDMLCKQDIYAIKQNDEYLLVDNNLQKFMDDIKDKDGQYNWYTTERNGNGIINNLPSQAQVKYGLAQLFDKNPGANNIIGNTTKSISFLSSEKIANRMQVSLGECDIHDNLFSDKQLREILEDIIREDSRLIEVSSDKKQFNFEHGDTITATVRVIDSDGGSSDNGQFNNSDRWLVTFQHVTPLYTGDNLPNEACYVGQKARYGNEENNIDIVWDGQQWRDASGGPNGGGLGNGDNIDPGTVVGYQKTVSLISNLDVVFNGDSNDDPKLVQ